jgi:hypothetical protein
MATGKRPAVRTAISRNQPQRIMLYRQRPQPLQPDGKSAVIGTGGIPYYSCIIRQRWCGHDCGLVLLICGGVSIPTRIKIRSLRAQTTSSRIIPTNSKGLMQSAFSLISI